MTTRLLQEIFETGKVWTTDGQDIALHSALDKAEGEAIYNLLKEHKISNTLEVGCAFGISSLYICDAIAPHRPNCNHTIIDPIQTTGWKGIGISNLEKSGFDFFSLIEKPSEIALPELLEQGRTFQFVLIDGWHTFDHALLDFFYADRMLEIGGFIAIDDTEMPQLHQVACFVESIPNYRVHSAVRSSHVSKRGAKYVCRATVDLMLKAIASSLPANYRDKIFRGQFLKHKFGWTGYGNMIFFQKIGPDLREGAWYEPF